MSMTATLPLLKPLAMRLPEQKVATAAAHVIDIVENEEPFDQKQQQQQQLQMPVPTLVWPATVVGQLEAQDESDLELDVLPEQDALDFAERLFPMLRDAPAYHITDTQVETAIREVSAENMSGAMFPIQRTAMVIRARQRPSTTTTTAPPPPPPPAKKVLQPSAAQKKQTLQHHQQRR